MSEKSRALCLVLIPLFAAPAVFASEATYVGSISQATQTYGTAIRALDVTLKIVSDAPATAVPVPGTVPAPDCPGDGDCDYLPVTTAKARIGWASLTVYDHASPEKYRVETRFPVVVTHTDDGTRMKLTGNDEFALNNQDVTQPAMASLDESLGLGSWNDSTRRSLGIEFSSDDVRLKSHEQNGAVIIDAIEKLPALIDIAWYLDGDSGYASGFSHDGIGQLRLIR